VNHSQIVSFIWGVADLIRDTFKRGKYQDVILPLTVLRRLDCVLAPTKEKVLQTVGKFKGKLENLDPQLRRASGFAFYNTSLRLREAPCGRAASRRKPAELHQGLQPEYARSFGEVRFR
jgi:type I restriction-modification system DNA methylase subunit